MKFSNKQIISLTLYNNNSIFDEKLSIDKMDEKDDVGGGMDDTALYGFYSAQSTGTSDA
jgi:hypothetical protein